MNKLTTQDIEKAITSTKYIYDDLFTICILTLHGVFKITGESACLSLETYNRKTGEEVAYKNAFEKVWEFEGYRLATDKIFHPRDLDDGKTKVVKQEPIIKQESVKVDEQKPIETPYTKDIQDIIDKMKDYIVPIPDMDKLYPQFPEIPDFPPYPQCPHHPNDWYKPWLLYNNNYSVKTDIKGKN